MAISLEELKRQREQIQQHLEWLDAKITELDHPKTSPEPKPEKAEVGAPNEAAETPPKTEYPSASAPAHLPDIEAPTYKAKTQGEVRRAKIGCFVLFILSTLLFLFLLFGLPYLL